MKGYYKEVAQKALNAFQHHSILVGLFERMLGGEILAHPRIPARNIFPKKVAFTTQPHQDYITIQGTTNHYAAWIPLGDCEVEMGGLEISRGSHKYGVYPIQPALGAGQQVTLIEHPQKWEYSPFAGSDVIIHNCLTLHRGVPNQSGQMRLFMDYPYQRVDEPICIRSLNPSHQLATWAEVYSGWDDDAYKYCWRDLHLDIVEYDYKYFDERTELAIQIGHAGDIQAQSCLEGIIQKYRDPGFRQRSTVALAALKALVD